MFNTLDLFAGIGGFSLGLERTGGFRTAAFCEIDEKAQLVLRKHWPTIPIYGDVTTLTKGVLDDAGISIDAITGGFPCQDISTAGKGLGLAGERSGLWFEFLRIIDETAPKYAIIENVAALRSRGLEVVLRGLAEIGYDAEWHCIPASAVGAPHRRDRVWVIAYPRREGRPRLVESLNLGSLGPWRLRGAEDLLDTDPFSSGNRWPRPLVRRDDDGVPGRVDRLKQLGNAVVPQIPELIGRAILEWEHNA